MPDIAAEVALFEKKYPKIKVNVVNAGQGLAEYTKLRTALKAGTGAPDVVQIEYSYIPTFTFTNNLIDLAPYGANDLKNDFVDWTWGQVSKGDKVYAIPQDTGPLGMLYRKDVFDQYGITVPATWDEFADSRDEAAPEEPEHLDDQLRQQRRRADIRLCLAGRSQPVRLEREPDLTDRHQRARHAEDGRLLESAGRRQVRYRPIPTSTTTGTPRLTNGTYATWMTAAWAPVFLQSSAAKSAGKWRVAPIPQWTSGANVSGNWGGSTSAVTNQTKNPEAAASPGHVP